MALGVGASWARGHGNACGVAGERAGARGMGRIQVFLQGIQPSCVFRRTHAVPPAHPCRAIRRSPGLRFGEGGGGFGVLLGTGALRDCGHRSAYGAAWEWAEPMAGERAVARGRG